MRIAINTTDRKLADYQIQILAKCPIPTIALCVDPANWEMDPEYCKVYELSFHEIVGVIRQLEGSPNMATNLIEVYVKYLEEKGLD